MLPEVSKTPCGSLDRHYPLPSENPALSMQPDRQRRRTITLDIPQDQIEWLDQQADLNHITRSAFVRQFVAAAMKEEQAA